MSVQRVEDLRLGEVAIIDAGACVLQSSYGIARLRGKVLSPGAQAFVSQLKAVEAELQAKAPRKASPSRARVRAARPR